MWYMDWSDKFFVSRTEGPFNTKEEAVELAKSMKDVIIYYHIYAD